MVGQKSIFGTFSLHSNPLQISEIQVLYFVVQAEGHVWDKFA